MNWTLISGIFAGLENLERSFKWSMSVGENARCAEIFYKHLSKGFPKSIEDVHTMFDEAYVYIWGEDHECDKTNKKEIKSLLYSVSDYYINTLELKAVNKIDYNVQVKRLLI